MVFPDAVAPGVKDRQGGEQLDPETVTNNIRALLDCCAAPVFDSSKILITSRTHFFETGDAYRLLGRLGKPLFSCSSNAVLGDVDRRGT